MSKKATSTYGNISATNLFAWADAQTASGAFATVADVTTEGIPYRDYWVGFLEVNFVSRRLTLTGSGTRRTFINVTTADIWNDWEIVPTATPPQEFDLPLAEGYVGGEGGAWAFKEQDNKVTLTVSDVQKSDATGIVTGIIGTIPAGYRPSKLISVACTMWTGNQSPGLLQVLPDGNVWVTVLATGCRSVHGQLTFVAISGPIAQ